MDKEKEYEWLMQLELETTKLRQATFTALLSISFILPSLALQCRNDIYVWFWTNTTLCRLVFLLGFMFYCFAVFHYYWYHRYSHAYRAALKKLEVELNVRVYRHRVRPQVGGGRFKLHFDWALYIIAIVYAGIAASYVGSKVFLPTAGVIVLLYAILVLASVWSPVEPLEK